MLNWILSTLNWMLLATLETIAISGSATILTVLVGFGLLSWASASLFQWELNRSVLGGTDREDDPEYPSPAARWLWIELKCSALGAPILALKAVAARFSTRALYRLETDQPDVLVELGKLASAADGALLRANGKPIGERDGLKVGESTTVRMDLKTGLQPTLAGLVKLGQLQHRQGDPSSGANRVRLRLSVHRVAKLTRPAGSDPSTVQEELLTASLGPTYLFASAICAVIYGLAFVIDPLLARSQGLSSGASGWDYIFFGNIPSMQMLLPLSQHTHLALMLTCLFWLVLWSLVARVIRISHASDLGRNLIKDRAKSGVLSFWRMHAGQSELHEPHPSYRSWAIYAAIGLGVLLLMAYSYTDNQPYRVPPGGFAVAYLFTLGWLFNLILRGRLRGGQALPEPAPVVTKEDRASWPDVLTHLYEKYQTPAPILIDRPRPVQPLAFSDRNGFASGSISPLLKELLPSGKLTPMQHEILSTISNRAQVSPVVAAEGDSLVMVGGPGSVLSDDEAAHDQVVVAPEGAGKSTLVMLAALNHVVTHTRRVLVVTASARQADAVRARFAEHLNPSTLRWTVLVRRAGAPLLDDLTNDITPDVVIASLDEIATDLLDGNDRAQRYLTTIGLVVVEDIESFCGATEVHAQMLFRRMKLRIAAENGEDTTLDASGPLRLAVGSDSMENLGAWTASILGGTPKIRRFDVHGRVHGDGKDAAQPAARSQQFLHMTDLRDRRGEPLSLQQIIDACETLRVPWCYRASGDHDRSLGRTALLLRQEPASYVDDPADAGVVFLAGSWSDVQRERERLTQAGARFTTQYSCTEGEEPVGVEPKGATIAMVSLVDPDSEMVFQQRDVHSDLHRMLRALPVAVPPLPHAIVRQRHLAGDLIRSWSEVGDLVRIYGATIADPLQSLAKQRLLQTERRIGLRDGAERFDRNVFVHALSEAVMEEDPSKMAELPQKANNPAYWETFRLPPSVDRVDHAALRYAEVVDPSTTRSLGVHDEGSAYLVYYPRCLFSDQRGNFQVIDYRLPRIRQSENRRSPMQIQVDPFVDPLRSSPRRRCRFSHAGEAPEADLRFLGAEPIALRRFDEATVRVEHLATYHLSPETLAVMDRIVKDPFASAKPGAPPDRPPDLTTAATFLYPCPAGADGKPSQPTEDRFKVGETEHVIDVLTLRQARLLVAALRLSLNVLFRGASNSVGVALHVDDARGQDDRLTPDDAIVFFDLHSDGNGMSRKIQDEHLSTLLRLARLVIERVIHQGRLMALYDHWGDPREIVEEARRDAAQEMDIEATKLMEEKRRHGALAWLDSRLRPEGRAVAGSTSGLYEPGAEEGEGDTFDIGRSWFSADSSVTDLMWSKLRWRQRDRRPASIDIGIGRRTVAHHVHLPESDEMASLQSGSEASVGPSWWVNADADPPGPELTSDLMPPASLAGACAALAALSRSPLTQAAAMLEEASGVQRVNTLADPLGDTGFWLNRRTLPLGDYLASFAQGIPHHDDPQGRSAPRSPVEVLIAAMGDPVSSSLLLVQLCQQLGIRRAGLFLRGSSREDALAGIPIGYFKCDDPDQVGATALRFLNALINPAHQSGTAVKPDGSRSHPFTFSRRLPDLWAVEPLSIVEANELGFDVDARARRCIICARELSAEDSTQYGIGPDCRVKVGHDKGPQEHIDKVNELCVEVSIASTTDERRLAIAQELRTLGFDSISTVIEERVGRGLYRREDENTESASGYHRLIVPVDTSGFYPLGATHIIDPNVWAFANPLDRVERVEPESTGTEAATIEANPAPTADTEPAAEGGE